MVGDIAEVADRLRMVRTARHKFLRLWAIDRSMIDPLVDRLAADLNVPADDPPPGQTLGHPDAPPADER